MTIFRQRGVPVRRVPQQRPLARPQAPQPQQPPPSSNLPKHVSGPIDRVPCPHCGKANDLRELHHEQLLDTGNIIDCSRCTKLFFIAAIKPVLHVAVREPTATDMGQRVQRSQAAQPARTLSPAQTQRVLNRGK